MKRYRVNKRRSAGKFRKQAARTKAANMGGLARGGWRM